MSRLLNTVKLRLLLHSQLFCLTSSAFSRPSLKKLRYQLLINHRLERLLPTRWLRCLVLLLSAIHVVKVREHFLLYKLVRKNLRLRWLLVRMGQSLSRAVLRRWHKVVRVLRHWVGLLRLSKHHVAWLEGDMVCFWVKLVLSLVLKVNTDNVFESLLFLLEDMLFHRLVGQSASLWLS